MPNLMIIPMVLGVSVITAAILAVVIYTIDKNARRRESRN